MPGKTQSDNPAVKITPKGVARLRAGHVWVYRSDVTAPEGVPPGALVDVSDTRGKLLGSALYSSSSQIALRMLSGKPLPAAELPALLRDRLHAALEYRQKVVHESDACRLVFSEADGLPGLIVDRYHDLISFQALTQAMDQRKEGLMAQVGDELKPAAIVERVEARIRELEQLPAAETRIVCGDKSKTVVTMNGVKFHFDALAGQKTGAFLDQRENYAAAARYARGRALDVFCYQGGFALHVASRCESVTGVDSSRPALEQAEQNAALNGREIEWIEANAFDLLRDYSDSGTQYDSIVLDPPAFAKTRKTLETAMRGYKELNLRALKMLRPGGVLVTCSCSYH
ncbi:MAG TPA: class I SAM-dependent rRNA methyltransferase, partial [Terriglobales bacterium]|nr:class I SAM-dependent rRNA methyltransferase [Terriglobales bacterium]